MPPDITLLVFSRNDLTLVKDLIEEVNPLVNDIEVIESSDPEKHVDFLLWAKNNNKIRVFYVPPLGYPDLLRPYSFTKCNNDWILLLDADERLSENLKRDLRNIIGNDIAEVYGIYRYPGTKEGKRLSNTRTLQIRLFNKNFLEEKGLMHKIPRSTGRYRVLPDKYHIIHLVKDKVNRLPEYTKLDQFSRMSYNNLPAKIRPLFKILNVYNPHNPESELTNKAYFLLFLAEEVYSGFATKNLRRLFQCWRYSKAKLERYKGFKKHDRNGLMFKISQQVNSEGMVNFLHFDSPEVVEQLNSIKEMWNLEGSDFLIRLMIKQYAKNCLSNINGNT